MHTYLIDWSSFLSQGT